MAGLKKVAKNYMQMPKKKKPMMKPQMGNQMGRMMKPKLNMGRKY